MKCQNCGKSQANIRYKENINGQIQEVYLCSGCAKNLGFLDFSDIFSPIFSSIPSVFLDTVTEKSCDKCGYDFNMYLKTGLFGCPNCYDSFSPKLDELLYNYHGKTRHVKSDNENIKNSINSKEELILNLQNELNIAIENEEYEKAAVLRDKIKEIKETKK